MKDKTMGKILVIAEKPSVGSDIAKVLGCTSRNKGYIEGDKYVVTWAVGHLIGLKDAKEHDEEYAKWDLSPLPFRFPLKDSLKVLPDTKEQFNIIKGLIHRKDIDSIINAGDAGREGLLIQEWIYRMAGNTLPEKILWASSFTEEALKKHFSSLKDPKDFAALLQEAEARAEGDWAYGINYSRALTLTYGGGKVRLIYGRCQTSLLNQIVLRDKEIEAFVKKPYYNIQACYEKGFNGILINDENKPVPILENTAADNILASLKNLPGPVVTECKTEDKRKQPPLLYNLAALQKAMGTRYGYAPEKTLQLAQDLYEKHKILTYPRTDSRFLSTDVWNEISLHLNAVYSIPKYRQQVLALKEIFGGSKPKLDKRYVNDHKVTDHYALIPTDAKNMGKEYESLTEDERNVFDAIVTVFIAMFMPDYEYKATTLIAQTGDYRFMSKGKVTTSPGYKAVFNNEEDETGEKEEDDQTLPAVSVGDELIISEYKRLDKETKPPARYTDNSIISLMEKNNIGTSATRAEIIKKLQNPKAPYIKRDKGKYISTALGREYISMLPDELKALDLTQRFEARLTDINEGRISKEQFLDEIEEQQKEYIRHFRESGKQVESQISNSSVSADCLCPICGSGIRFTSKGYFCSKEGCGFALWPTMKHFSNVLKITEGKAKALLTGKKHARFTLKKKDGSSYEAFLKIKLTDVNGKTYVNFEHDGFPHTKK